MSSFKENIFIHKKYIHVKEIIFTHFKDIIFTQSIVLIQGNYIHSRKSICSRKLYSFKNVEFPDIVEIFI